MPDDSTVRFQAALDLCETLLAPGGKARISPYLLAPVSTSERFLVSVYQSVMLDLLRSGCLPGDLVLLESDSAFSVGTIAAFDALLAWQTACMLYGVEPGLRSVRVQGLADEQSLRVFGDALALRAEHLSGLPALDHTRRWLTEAVAPPSLPPNLALFAFPWQIARLDHLLSRLPPGAIVAAVAWQRPGVQPAQLFSWRYQLLRQRDDYVALGPCGQEYGRDLPAACQTCFHGRRAMLHVSEDDVMETPAWSYVVLIKRSEPIEQPGHSFIATTGFSKAEIDDLHVRYLGTIREKDIVAAHPDEFNDNPADKKWHEYLRLCPGHTDLTKLAIEGNAGMQLPRLRYGQWLRLQRARPSKPYAQAPDFGILRLPDEATLHRIPGLPIEETFLPAYTPVTRAAVDETAYRLFGFEAMWPFQHTVLERILCGGDIFAIAATGGGKSECYILPAMLLPGITVVVSPLKSLMQDQYEHRIRDRYGLDYLTTFINGDVKFYERQGRLRRAVLGHFKLLYVTPEQLERGYVLDVLRQAAQTVGVRYVALDEAHCISQWGHDFRPSYLNIVERLRDYDLHPRRIALTATASPLVRDDVCQELSLDKRTLREGGHVLIDSANRPELNLVVQRVHSTEEKARIIVDALKRQQDGSAIVFMPHTGGSPEKPRDFGTPRSMPRPENAGMVSSGVSPFARYLEQQLGHPVARYHGAMDDSREDDGGSSVDAGDEQSVEVPTRQGEQRLFMNSKKRVMVATKGFGMGIDKPDIRLVIHRSPTANLEAYAQEAGRAGRDGELATVMLLFSEDRPQIAKVSPTDFLFRDTLQSDREIQEFFTEQRYVRRQDVEAMIAFLSSDRPRQVNRAFYFTNDLVMEVFDACERRPDLLGLSRPYEWPKFQGRRIWSWESDDHKRIRDRGYLYSEKRKYIGRILKVLYNNRPTLHGVIVPLIHAAHETGIVLRSFHLYAPERIVASPAYFGERLRRAGVEAQELCELLPNGDQVDLTRLAVRLGLSLRETASMLYDVRSCEGRTGQSGDWIGTLLNYQRVEAPRWVRLSDPYDTAAWREYAGAYTRARGGESKTLDAYFPEWTLNKPTGWEVRPGEGLDYPDRRAYLDAFMTLHDERRDNDESNFAYLIDRYIGASGDARACLRSLLLGYLKTGETVVGGNCLGCSVCVPDLDFERYPVAQRKSVVVRLMIETLNLLDAVEQCNRQPLPVELGQQLLAAIAQENAQGRSGTAYLESWLARLIQDDPEHQGALWLRLRAFEQGALSLSSLDVVTAIARLVQLTRSTEFVDDLGRIVVHCLEASGYSEHRAALLQSAAQLAGRRGVWVEEARLWQQACDLLTAEGQEAQTILVRLLELYHRADRLNDPARAAEIANRLIQLSTLSLPEAQAAYAVLARRWTWADVEAELKSRHAHPAAALSAWLETGTAAARKGVVGWLARRPEVLTRWPTTALRDIAQHLQTELSSSPQALLALADTLLLTPESTAEAVGFLVQAWAAGGDLSAQQSQALAADLLKLDATECRQRFASRPDVTDLLTALWQARGKSDFPLRWLSYVPEGTLQRLPEDIFVQVWAAFVALKTPLEESLLSDLVACVEISGDVGVPLLAQVVTERPDLALQILQVILKRGDAPKTAMVKVLFPALLTDTVDSHQVVLCLSALSTDRALYRGDARMFACLDTWKALQEDHTTWPLLRQRRVESTTLVDIAKKWMAYQDELQRLDMLVIILQDVCSRSPSTWMTPISLEFQALCAAGRFSEAQEIVDYNPDLHIQGRDAATYLKEAQARRHGRQGAYEAELRRLWALVEIR
jgi:superfamily II DNA helicase RecQ